MRLAKFLPSRVVKPKVVGLGFVCLFWFLVVSEISVNAQYD